VAAVAGISLQPVALLVVRAVVAPAQELLTAASPAQLIQEAAVAEKLPTSMLAQAVLVLLSSPYRLPVTQEQQQVHQRLRLADLTPSFSSTHQEVIQHEPFCKSY
jgi:hypothetical protein